jgi:hypothetical protein
VLSSYQLIKAKINSFKQVAGQAVFEIGKRLKHVKENDLAHWEWAKWCEDEVKLSSTQANKYVAVVERFSNHNLSFDLGINALHLISSMSDEQIIKEHMVPSTNEVKSVGLMTNAELREVAKAVKLAEAAELRAEHKMASILSPESR